jgi:hypothetical protein
MRWFPAIFQSASQDGTLANFTSPERISPAQSLPLDDKSGDKSGIKRIAEIIRICSVAAVTCRVGGDVSGSASNAAARPPS